MALLFGFHPDDIERLTPTQMREYHGFIEARHAAAAAEDDE